MSQLQDVAGYIIGALGAALAALAGLVRSGDMHRIKSIEDKQTALANEANVARDKLYDEIKDLRRDVDRKHGELVTLITERTR